MFASLHHNLSQPESEPETEQDHLTPPHEVIGRLAYLIELLTQEQQVKLLRALFLDGFLRGRAEV